MTFMYELQNLSTKYFTMHYHYCPDLELHFLEHIAHVFYGFHSEHITHVLYSFHSRFEGLRLSYQHFLSSM